MALRHHSRGPPSFEVRCAATVAEGVELLMAAVVDVVLLDCILPGETMWQIVLEADRQNVPVVLMTGDPAQMKEAGAGRGLTFSSRSPWPL